jgi:phospholipase/carboxylesterase
MLSLPAEPAVRFVFPHAPMRPITLNGGMVMRGWYDLTGLEVTRHEDVAGLEQSSALVTGLIEQESARGILPSQVFLGGFSQGGALALHVGLRYTERLAGIVALSTYLPVSDQTRAERSEANRPTAIFMAHGLFDPVVVLPFGEASHQALEEMGYDMTWRTYPIQHSVSESEMSDLSFWIAEHVGKSVGAKES